MIHKILLILAIFKTAKSTEEDLDSELSFPKIGNPIDENPNCEKIISHGNMNFEEEIRCRFYPIFTVIIPGILVALLGQIQDEGLRNAMMIIAFMFFFTGLIFCVKSSFY